MDSKFFVASVFSLIALATLTACGGDGGGGPTSYTYNSTTSRGDLVNYTITGSNASIQWHVTNNVGAISFTWNTTATCGAHDATYGHRTCTIVSSTCTAGVEACPVTLPSGDIEILEIPGTALIAHVPTAVAWLADGSTHDELHTGFISGGCPADVSGDYAYVSTGRANGTNSATDLFGIFRSDATFNEITHADFGMTTVGSAALNTAVANYVTSDTAGAVTLTGDSCANGIFTRGLNGQTTRLNITQGSGFIFDFPAGQGGLIALKTSTAALLADLAGRNWRGISFPDTIEPELLSVTTSAVSAGSVSLSGTASSGEIISGALVKPATGGAALIPANKFDAPTNYLFANSGNPLQTAYPTPGHIPGLFQIDQAPDSNIVAIASRVGTQVMIYGVVFNFRDGSGAGCIMGEAECIPRNSGNFILFSH